MLFLYIFLGFIGLILIYLIVIIFFPVFQVDKQPINKELVEKEIPSCRQDVEFMVEGLKISGWLYLPESKKDLTCVVMSHGFCGTKDFALEDFALRFVQEGFAVLTFDFRYFGESEGMPRQWHCGAFQYVDLKAAVEYARSREEIDERKIVVWGTSGGAPYGISLAGEDDKLLGVIAQVGSYNHKEDNKIYIEEVGWMHFMRMIPHAQRDKGRSRFGLSPHKYPPYGKPGTFSMLNLPGTFEGIEELAKESKTFENEICARVAFMPHHPDPMKIADKIECKVLFVVATKDNLVSPRSHIALDEILGDKSQVVSLEYDHWQVYKGEPFKENIKHQIDFLNSL